MLPGRRGALTAPLRCPTISSARSASSSAAQMPGHPPSSSAFAHRTHPSDERSCGRHNTKPQIRLFDDPLSQVTVMRGQCPRVGAGPAAAARAQLLLLDRGMSRRGGRTFFRRRKGWGATRRPSSASQLSWRLTDWSAGPISSAGSRDCCRASAFSQSSRASRSVRDGRSSLLTLSAGGSRIRTRGPERRGGCHANRLP